MITNLDTQYVLAGETLITAGQPVKMIYFVDKGKLVLSASMQRDPEDEDDNFDQDELFAEEFEEERVKSWHDVVELGEGSFFGEYQVLNGVKSCWTVRAGSVYATDKGKQKTEQSTLVYSLRADTFLALQEDFEEEFTRIKWQASLRNAYFKQVTNEWIAFIPEQMALRHEKNRINHQWTALQTEDEQLLGEDDRPFLSGDKESKIGNLNKVGDQKASKSIFEVIQAKL